MFRIWFQFIFYQIFIKLLESIKIFNTKLSSISSSSDILFILQQLHLSLQHCHLLLTLPLTSKILILIILCLFPSFLIIHSQPIFQFHTHLIGNLIEVVSTALLFHFQLYLSNLFLMVHFLHVQLLFCHFQFPSIFEQLIFSQL